MATAGEFHEEMLKLYDESTYLGFYPTIFLRMILDEGGLATARHLLKPTTTTYGLRRLRQEGRLDLSVEALVLREPWRSLFTERELDEAKRRLRRFHYDFDEEAGERPPKR